MKGALTMAAVGLLAVGLLQGCASAARSTAMVAPVTAKTLIEPSSPLYKKMVIRSVTGGEETNILWKSKVSSGEFREALETSLDLAAILGTASKSELMLEATLESLEQPQLAVNLEVITTVHYKVTRFDGTVAFDERIETAYTEQFFNSLVRAERQRLANEGSVKANIAEFMNRLVAASREDPARFQPPAPEPAPAEGAAAATGAGAAETEVAGAQ